MSALGCTTCIVNVLIAICGKGLTYYGFNLKSSTEYYFEGYYELLPASITSIAYIIILMGILTIIIGWFGVFNCNSESSMMLKAYACCLSALLVFKITYAIILYTSFLREAAKKFVYANFNSNEYDVAFILNEVTTVLEATGEEICDILIYFIILEGIAVICVWCSVPEKAEAERQQVIVQRQEVTGVIVLTPPPPAQGVHATTYVQN